jgi:hypothetical protein
MVTQKSRVQSVIDQLELNIPPKTVKIIEMVASELFDQGSAPAEDRGAGVVDLDDDFYLVVPVMIPAYIDEEGCMVAQVSSVDFMEEVKMVIKEWRRGECDLYVSDGASSGNDEEMKLEPESGGIIEVE